MANTRRRNIKRPVAIKKIHHDKNKKPYILDTQKGQDNKRYINYLLFILCIDHLPGDPKTVLCLDDHRFNTSRTFSDAVVHSPNLNADICEMAELEVLFLSAAI
jgi:hypothetical protein